MGDGWWEAGEKETGRNRESHRSRAWHWYRIALPKLAGLTLIRVEKRLAQGPQDVSLPKGIPGLIGSWTFDEGAGEVARDSSGRNNHGTLVNGVAWVKGRHGSALSFDGVDDHVTLSAEGIPAANAPQSLSWSQRYVSTPRRLQHFITLSDAVPSSSVQPGFINGRIGVWKYGGVFLVSALPPAENAWHAFAYAFDGTSHRFFVDGVLADTSVIPPNSAKPKKFEIGRWWEPHVAGYYSGMIDDLRIFERALTDDEVRSLAGIK